MSTLSDEAVAGRHPAGRRWVQAVVGALLGVAVHGVLLAVSFGRGVEPAPPGDLRGLDYVLFADVVATPMMWLVGGAFAVSRRSRPFGLGMIVGAAIGVIAGGAACVALTIPASELAASDLTTTAAGTGRR